MTRLFFCTDLHGSEICFRKFVAAASFYGADLLVLGGDVTGKLVTPIVTDGADEAWVESHGEKRALRGAQIEEYEQHAAAEGVYTARMTAEEHEHYARHPDEVDALFESLMLERLAHWIDYARERLDGSGVRVLTAPGNDDPYVVYDLIRDRGDEGPVLYDSLAVAGRAGTLKDRLRNSVARDRCRGKTGTLRDVSNVAGYCTTADGRTLGFAILMNAVNPWAARKLQDRMLSVIARYSG